MVDPHYRVAIFGSARIKEGDGAYRDVFAISKQLAAAGFDIVTGGGPGLMQAANAGHRSVATSSHSIGLNIKLPLEQQANKYLDIKEEFSRFSDRLDTFMALSDAVIVATGGIGTLLEFFYTWQLVQVKHLCETPIVLFGEMWGGLLKWLGEEVEGRGMFDGADLHNLFHFTEVGQVVPFLLKVHEDRGLLEHVCINYRKYRKEFSGF